MILVGLKCRWTNCVGAEHINTYFFEAKDIHEAAVETLKSSWSNPWQCLCVISGEFHDTSSLNTWSVDSGGHTKRDYRKEETETFKKRWKLYD